jgi:predicted nucleic acid-binding protein
VIPTSPDARTFARLLRYSRERLRASAAIANRAAGLEKAGLDSLDALHLAFAEAANCDNLFTTDDRFVRRVKRGSLSATVRVENPARWLLEMQDGGETA